MANKHIPEIRFKGFEDEWEEDTVGEVSTSYSGGTPSVINKDFYRGNIPFIRSAEINSLKTELFINEDALNCSSAKFVEVGDILYALYGATSGEVGISNINGAINQAILAIKPNEGYDSNFIVNWFKYHKEKILEKYLQGGQGNLSGSIIKELKIFFPKEIEQQKIGTFFKQLDDSIDRRQQELDHLKQTKQAFLQKMFPKEGQTVPEIRFKGFDVEWEEALLGDISKIYDGTHQTPEYKKEGIMFLSVENISSLKSSKFISKEAFEKNFKIKPMKDDLLMTRIGDVGTVNIIRDNFPVAFYVSLALIRTKIDSDFLKHSIGTDAVQKEIWKKTLHIAFPKKINLNEISNIKILFPAKIEEQQKIGTFFKQLDDKIQLHERELEGLKQTKQAFLQMMFV